VLRVREQRPRGLGAKLPAAGVLRKEPKNLAIFDDLCLFQQSELCWGSGGSGQEVWGLSSQPLGF